ncbi:Rwd Domain-Containing Protein 1 [Manis pentadactyla]|nr:Rwd Domain-Containing Protein 1 [Manis pentadactyla]
MTDYSEEPHNEQEAPEFIYPNSFTVLSEYPPSFSITVTSGAGENDDTVQTALKFTYSKKYPDEAPLYDIFSQENLEDNDVSDTLKLLAITGREKPCGKQLLETDHDLDTSDIQFLEDAVNCVAVDESLFQETGDVELEDNEDDPDYNPADPESDLTD